MEYHQCIGKKPLSLSCQDHAQAAPQNGWAGAQPLVPRPMINPGMLGVMPMLPAFGSQPVPQMPQGPGPDGMRSPARGPVRGRGHPPRGRSRGQSGQGRAGRALSAPQGLVPQAPGQAWLPSASFGINMPDTIMMAGYLPLLSIPLD